MPEQDDRDRPRIDAVGDAALLLTLGDDVDVDVNARAARVADGLRARAARLDGLGEPVVGHASVLAPFDPDVLPEDRLAALLLDLAARPDPGVGEASGRLHELTVRYGGADGPDLADVAARAGLSEAEAARLHAAVEYRVLVIGFVPGFPYLAAVPPALEVPRRATPRLRVPAGSVAIAGRQTGIYPFATSGGWHLIGRTDAPLWDPRRDPPALLTAGDRVRFVPG